MQWQHNMGHLPVVDVVVDPHIVRQLRPHQREGVTFLYQCLLGMKAYRGYGAILAYVLTVSTQHLVEDSSLHDIL